MKWLKADTFSPKPIVIIEDHMFHLQEILKLMDRDAPFWLSQTTLVSLDRPGPDTTKAIQSWLTQFPDLQVVSRLDTAGAHLLERFPNRLREIPDQHFKHQITFCKLITSLLRPGGFLIQDIQLSTLTFLPPDQWWASIYLANSIRGSFPKRPPMCWFMSNKTGFSINFGRELMEAGFDPRDVIDKTKLDSYFVPTIIEDLNDAFPLELSLSEAEGEPWLVPLQQADSLVLEDALDIVLWQLDSLCELGGTQVKDPQGKSRVSLRPKSHEAHTWSQLLQDYFELGSGICISTLGSRIATKDASKAECTNAAARHIHVLRKRLRDPQSIVTMYGVYRLSPHLKVGIVSRARRR